MLHLMKYRLLTIFRDKGAMFWSLLFSICLCTLFSVTFGSMDDTIEKIPTAVVMENESKEALQFKDFLEEMENSDSKIISLKYMNEKQAKRALEKDKVKGIFFVNDEPRLMVSSSEIEPSVLNSLMDGYNRQFAFVNILAKEKPEKMQEAAKLVEMHANEYIKETTITGKEVDSMVQYYYSLIAMACLYGCFLGLKVAMDLQANIKEVAARRGVASMNKLKAIIADTIVATLIDFVCVMILILYMTNVCKIDIGHQWGKTMLISAVGSLIGVTLGMFVGSIGKCKEGARYAIIISVSMVSSFLSGLMVGGIKGLIEESCPIINRINPASIISDALYSIDIYEDAMRFQRDIISLCVIAVVMVAASYLMIRRERYDSI